MSTLVTFIIGFVSTFLTCLLRDLFIQFRKGRRDRQVAWEELRRRDSQEIQEIQEILRAFHLLRDRRTTKVNWRREGF